MVYRITSAYALRDIFKAYDRDYYTYDAYEYMLEFFDEIGEPDYEVDVIGLCGMFSEYDMKEFIEEFADAEDCEDIVKYYDGGYADWVYAKINDGQDEDDLDPEQYFEDAGITDTIEEYIANDDDLFEEYLKDYFDGTAIQLNDGNILVIE